MGGSNSTQKEEAKQKEEPSTLASIPLGDDYDIDSTEARLMMSTAQKDLHRVEPSERQLDYEADQQNVSQRRELGGGWTKNGAADSSDYDESYDSRVYDPYVARRAYNAQADVDDASSDSSGTIDYPDREEIMHRHDDGYSQDRWHGRRNEDDADETQEEYARRVNRERELAVRCNANHRNTAPLDLHRLPSGGSD
eukprot:4471347-Pleurochrysis_carterae.AAC.1